jgi:hypothetical protein
MRNGNFSQLANVLQSGGDEGMWTFDRYQRWMEQVSDWVRPSQTPILQPTGERKPAFDPSIRKPAVQPAPTRPTPARSATADEVIDVPSEDMDLAELAELAKKVVERKSSGST